MKPIYRKSENCYCQCATGLDYAKVCIGCETEETFTCPACKRPMPYSMGCDDDFYELCDDCYSVAEEAGFKSDLDYLINLYGKTKMTYPPKETFIPIEPVWIEIEQAKFKFSEIVSLKYPETPEDFWCVTLSDNCWFLLTEQEASALNGMLVPSVFIGTKSTQNPEKSLPKGLAKKIAEQNILVSADEAELIGFCDSYYKSKGFDSYITLNPNYENKPCILLVCNGSVAWKYQGESIINCLIRGLETIFEQKKRMVSS